MIRRIETSGYHKSRRWSPALFALWLVLKKQKPIRRRLTDELGSVLIDELSIILETEDD